MSGWSEWLCGIRASVWLAVGAGFAIVLGANAHLVYVATRSQPDCVPHMRRGEGAAGLFSAAASACAPATTHNGGGRR